jgi:serine/threonine protein kinase
MQDLSIYDHRKSEVKIVKQLGKAGGEGTVYLTENSTAIKIFDPSKVDLLVKEKKVDLLLKSAIIEHGLCLPTAQVFNEAGNFIGYQMEYAKGDILQSCIFIRTQLLKMFPDWNRVNLANLCLTILDKVEVLHSKHLIIGDVNPYNIIINNENEVYFVDTDSFQINNFPCTVGKPLFTPPELQGADFKKTFRTKDNEYYSIATLLFMIFLPGKNPFAYRGGGDLGETIKAQNFSYPLGENDNLQAPKGIWEFIWNEFTYEIRRAFFDALREGRRLNLKEWQDVINSYKDEMLKGACPTEIFPTQFTHKQDKYKTLSFAGNIHESNKKLRNDATTLTVKTNDKKIGVIELSTTSVKLLFGEQKKIKNEPFNFHHYTRNFSHKTNTGDLVDVDRIMNLELFNERVIPKINDLVDKASRSKVDVLYTVATAAYRGSYNRNEIVDLIRSRCGINTKILSKKEEAIATLRAFSFSKPKNVGLEKDKNYMFIDQGGGSTEITVFSNQEVKQTYTLNLGSTVLRNIFFKEATERTSFEKMFKDAEKLIKDRLRVYLRNYNPQNLADYCISVGSAIIHATGGKTASDKHGVVLSLEDIKDKISEFDKYLRENFTSVSHLKEAIEEDLKEQLGRERKRDQVDNYLIARISLPMYLEIMERFKIRNVVVNNTGLYYGILIEKLFPEK